MWRWALTDHVCLWRLHGCVLGFIHLSTTGVVELAEFTDLKGCPYTFVYIVYVKTEPWQASKHPFDSYRQWPSDNQLSIILFLSSSNKRRNARVIKWTVTHCIVKPSTVRYRNVQVKDVLCCLWPRNSNSAGHYSGQAETQLPKHSEQVQPHSSQSFD
jgi:hypothetical protein